VYWKTYRAHRSNAQFLGLLDIVGTSSFHSSSLILFKAYYVRHKTPSHTHTQFHNSAEQLLMYVMLYVFFFSFWKLVTRMCYTACRRKALSRDRGGRGTCHTGSMLSRLCVIAQYEGSSVGSEAFALSLPNRRPVRHSPQMQHSKFHHSITQRRRGMISYGSLMINYKIVPSSNFKGLLRQVIKSQTN